MWIRDRTTTSTYDLFGNVATTTHPLGNTLTRTYDEKSRLELTQNGAGDQIVSGYDTLDRKLPHLYKISDDTNRTIEYGSPPETVPYTHLHLPTNWPWQDAWQGLFEAAYAPS